MYVFGKKIRIETDNRVVFCLFSKFSSRTKEARILRWREWLSNYSFELRHINTKDNITADLLSRLPNKCVKTENDDEIVINMNSLTVDETLLITDKIREVLEKGKPASVFENTGYEKISKVLNEIEIINSRAFFRNRMIVEEFEKRLILENIHLSHIGFNKAYSALRNLYWWSGLKTDLKNVFHNCNTCRLSSRTQMKQEAEIRCNESFKVWQELTIDLTGLFQTEEFKNILVIIDRKSKWPEVVFLTTTASNIIINKMSKIFCRMDLPESIFSDNGPQFTALMFRRFCKRNKIENKYTPVYSPKSNGLSERFMRTIKYVIEEAKKRSVKVLIFLP